VSLYIYIYIYIYHLQQDVDICPWCVRWWPFVHNNTASCPNRQRLTIDFGVPFWCVVVGSFWFHISPTVLFKFRLIDLLMTSLLGCSFEALSRLCLICSKAKYRLWHICFETHLKGQNCILPLSEQLVYLFNCSTASSILSAQR